MGQMTQPIGSTVTGRNTGEKWCKYQICSQYKLYFTGQKTAIKKTKIFYVHYTGQHVLAGTHS